LKVLRHLALALAVEHRDQIVVFFQVKRLFLGGTLVACIMHLG
jgi:hypothetical protein